MEVEKITIDFNKHPVEATCAKCGKSETIPPENNLVKMLAAIETVKAKHAGCQ